MFSLAKFKFGISSFLLGFRWLRRNPKYLMLLFLPSLLGLAGVISAAWGFFSYHDPLLEYFTPEFGEGWFFTFIEWLVVGVVYLGFLLVTLVMGILIAQILAAPIYELISCAVESQITGKVEEVSIWASLRLIPEELKKVALILAISIAVFLIPGLNALGFLVTAFLLGWDAYDYPLARRGFSFNERTRMAKADALSILGLGLWSIIPIANLIFIPLSIPGGTILSLRALDNNLALDNIQEHKE